MEVNTTSTVDPVNMYNYLNNFALNPNMGFRNGIYVLTLALNVDALKNI